MRRASVASSASRDRRRRASAPSRGRSTPAPGGSTRSGLHVSFGAGSRSRGIVTAPRPSRGWRAAADAPGVRRRAHAPDGRVPAGLERAAGRGPATSRRTGPRPGASTPDPAEQLAIDEVMRELHVPRPLNPIGIGWAGPTLLVAGTDASSRRVAARASSTAPRSGASSSASPSAGSDLASLHDARGARRRRVRRERPEGLDDARARRAVRHPARPHRPRRAEAHQGITYFVVDMRTPGIEVRPIVQMTGTHEFNEVFFTDVRVPAANVVGTEHDGWRLAKVTLGNERVSLSGEGALWGRGPTAQRRARSRARARRHARRAAAPTARRGCTSKPRCCGSSGCAPFRRGCAGSSPGRRRRCARRCPTSTAST